MKKLVAKTVILLIGLSCFLGLTQMAGVDYRSSQEMFYLIGGIVIFSLVLDNIWLTFFLWLSLALFTMGKFQFGFNYIINLFLGSVVYYVTRLKYTKYHINYFLNCVLWLTAINMLMMVLQSFGLDFVFYMQQINTFGKTVLMDNYDPTGFMGFKAAVGVLCAMAIPIMATRQSKWAIPISVGLFVPLYISRASITVVGGVIGLLFVLWYRVSRKVFISLVLAMALLGTAYVVKVDMPMGHMPTRTNQWKLALRDCVIHPVLGWGLDSFRNVTEKKKHVYAMNYQIKGNEQHFDYWDNAHNLYIQLWFEWGLIALLLLIGYIRQCSIWFKYSIKEPNTIALAGTLIVFFIVSIAQFPMFLARTACFIIPLFALYEIQTRD